MASSITMIKKDAIINLQVGAGFLQKVQHVLTGLASERTAEELDEFKLLIEKGHTEFPEDWMEYLFTLSVFVRTLEAEAIKQNATYEQDIDALNNLQS